MSEPASDVPAPVPSDEPIHQPEPGHSWQNRIAIATTAAGLSGIFGTGIAVLGLIGAMSFAHSTSANEAQAWSGFAAMVILVLMLPVYVLAGFVVRALARGSSSARWLGPVTAFLACGAAPFGGSAVVAMCLALAVIGAIAGGLAATWASRANRASATP